MGCSSASQHSLLLHIGALPESASCRFELTFALLMSSHRMLAAEGCPVDTPLPRREGASGPQPSTLEAWLAQLQACGWPQEQGQAKAALALSRALLESAAAQGSMGQPSHLSAAEALDSAELVAAVRTAFPALE